MQSIKIVIFLMSLLSPIRVVSKVKNNQTINHLAVLGSLRNAGNTFLDGNLSVKGAIYADYIQTNSINATITGNIIGSASLNVLKSGDTMTGNLRLANQSAVQLGDSGSKTISFQAPTTLVGSYTLTLPSALPLVNQVLKTNNVSPDQFDWVTLTNSGGGAQPSITRTIYVSKAGNDSVGDGSFNNPYLTVAKGVQLANTLATFDTPVTVSIGGGIFVEDNSGSPIEIVHQGIALVGESTEGTVIQPADLTNNLFNITEPDTEMDRLTIDAGGDGSTALGIAFNSNAAGTFRIESVSAYRFSTAVSIAGDGASVVVVNNFQSSGNGVGIEIEGSSLVIKNSVFLGPFLGGIAANTGIVVTGSPSLVAIMSCAFRLMTTAITASDNASVRIVGNNIESTTNGVVCSGAANIEIVGTNFIKNNSDSLNVLSTGIGTQVTIVGSLLHGNDGGIPFGTGAQANQGGYLEIVGTHLNSLDTAIIAGNTDDTSDTQVVISNAFINQNNLDIIQNGSSTLQVTSTPINVTLVTLNDPTNVTLTTFDLQNRSVLSIGNTTNSAQSLIQINNGDGVLPLFRYIPNFYGYDSLVYSDGYGTNSLGTGFGLLGNNLNGSVQSSITSTNSSGDATLSLQSDTLNLGTDDSTRGWALSRAGSNALLVSAFKNNDLLDGKSLVASYTVMQLDGFNNKLEFPSSFDGGTTLHWQNDTNLYRSASGILKTDTNLVVGGTETINGTLSLQSGSITDSSNALSFGSNAVTTTGSLHSAATTITGVSDTPQLQVIGNGTQTASLVEFKKHDTSNLLTLSNGGSLILTGSMTSSGIITMNVPITSISSSKIVATKEYVDNTASGLVPIGSVQAVSTSNLTLTGNKTIDGYSTTAGDQVLLTGQNTGSQNGPWVVATGPWSRPTNFASGSIIVGGVSVFVVKGDTYQNSTWVLSSGAGGTVDTTPIQFTLFSQPGTPSGSNVGGATGTIFQGITSNNFAFKTISGSNHVTITNNINTVDISTDATSSNTASKLVARDSSGNFSAGAITATTFTGTLTTAAQPNITSVGSLSSLVMTGTLNLGTHNITNGGTVTATTFVGALTGTASGNLPLSGGILTGALRLPAGSTSSPALNFTGSTTTGLSASSNNLSFSTSGSESMKISSSGAVSINGFSTVGVVHNDTSGNLTSSLIVNSDISLSAGIVDSKLATITTSGKVANSATTGTAANTPSTLVLRDSSGNFSAGSVTATTFTGTLSAGPQPNITSVGTLTSLVMSGTLNLNTHNITNGGTITATNLAGTLTTAAQPNITSVGSLSSLVMTGTLNLGTHNITNGGTVTATTFVGALTGTASGNLPLSGGILTGALRLPAGSTSSPALNFTGSTTTGFSAASGALSISTAGTERLKIASSGTLSVNAFSTAGVVHNDASGNLSSSLIVDADISSSAAIANSKLATLTASGLVSNSATTATSANTANAIVARDASGNFTAGTITATNFAGTLTTAAQTNITSVGSLTGLTMGGTLNLATNNITNGGTITATNLAGTVTTAAQTNITSLGSLTGLTVTNSFATGASGRVLFSSGLCQNIQYVTPLNGGTTTVAATTGVLVCNVGANIGSHTIALPATPTAGQMLSIVAGPANITTVTFSGGTVVNAPTTFAPGNQTARSTQLIYNLVNTSWYVTS